MYVLHEKLQAKLSHSKWIDRSRVGMFLKYSPVHASSVPLVLNTTTACVSPQFHCFYDDEFATCKQDAKFKSYWQYKGKFKEGNQSLIELLTNNSTHFLPSPQNF